jgi:hypothetical protein
MRKLAILLCSLAIALGAQTVTCTTRFNQTTCSKPQTDYVNPIIDAMKASAEAKLKARQQKAQEDQFQQELQIQKEQLQLQKEQLQFQKEPVRSPFVPTVPNLNDEQERQRAAEDEGVQVTIAKTLQSLRDRYPDLDMYAAKMVELSDAFVPGKKATSYGYIQGLYLIAKHGGMEQ